MDDSDLTLLLKFLVHLRAENLAIRKILQSRDLGDAGMDGYIEEQMGRLKAFPEISKVLQTDAQSPLAALLERLQKASPK